MLVAPLALRRLALAVAVLHDIDLLPQPAGLIVTGSADLHVSWPTVSAVIAPAGDDDDDGQVALLAAWLQARRALAEDAPLLGVLGMPTDHSHHPGRAWIQEMVPGNALSLGLAFLPADGESCRWRPLPAGVLEHAGVDEVAVWKEARAALERQGALAAVRDRRHTSAALTPVGDTDVVTLLGTRTLRRELASRENDGLAALIVPLRTRGWRATSVTDPAYGPALAAAMPPEERGFDRPILVTADELTEVRAGGDPMRLLRRGEESHRP